MNEKIVVTAENYDLIDGRNAYHSQIKRLSLGAPVMEENKNMQIAAQIWKENKAGKQEISAEIPIHQILDLMILLGNAMAYFQEAYRMPLLYNPEKPEIERVGVQGGVMPISICLDNPNINEDIQGFSQSLSDLGELTGDRLRSIARMIEVLECY